jgi:hypothetical protein
VTPHQAAGDRDSQRPMTNANGVGDGARRGIDPGDGAVIAAARFRTINRVAAILDPLRLRDHGEISDDLRDLGVCARPWSSLSRRTADRRNPGPTSKTDDGSLTCRTALRRRALAVVCAGSAFARIAECAPGYRLKAPVILACA